eukprot:Mycagemm_TRINITY_DN8360_c0_g1::TRINITY_DN8360_c0_g1_i1::g.5541::m.5541 type:complete len:121 gc:universal TRINITY_DN8360_c0_g1_i1:204-566(+)
MRSLLPLVASWSRRAHGMMLLSTSISSVSRSCQTPRPRTTPSSTSTSTLLTATSSRAAGRRCSAASPQVRAFCSISSSSSTTRVAAWPLLAAPQALWVPRSVCSCGHTSSATLARSTLLP